MNWDTNYGLHPGKIIDLLLNLSNRIIIGV